MSIPTSKRFFFVVLIFLSVLNMGSTLYSGEDARELVRKADEKMRGKTSFVEMTVQTVRPSWTRELKLKSWAKGTQYSLIYITAPAKEKGIVYLKRENEIWNWVPSIERTIKLPPSMLTQSWMGTDFSNDDLLKESSIVEDYIHGFAGDSIIQGRTCKKIKLIPKPDAPVVWGMIMIWVDVTDYLQLRVEFFDEEMELVNTMESYEIKMLGGRLLPARVEMIPAGKKGNKTIIIHNSIRFDEPIADNFFTLQNIKIIK